MLAGSIRTPTSLRLGSSLNGKSGFDAPTLRAESVALLDAAFGVFAVAAHVPFAGRAGDARDGIGTANDADDQIAFVESAVCGRFFHAAERLVAEDQVIAARRRPAVLGGNELEIGSANSQIESANQIAAVTRRGSGTS